MDLRKLLNLNIPQINFDWKTVFRFIIDFIPQLAEAINWIKKNVNKYTVKDDGNKITIEIEIKDNNNMDEIKQYLIEFMELITDKKPDNKD